jgi:hypothetical protein
LFSRGKLRHQDLRDGLFTAEHPLRAEHADSMWLAGIAFHGVVPKIQTSVG